MGTTNSQPSAAVRLDKWLWAARCFKTRSLASAACSAGHVKVNGAAGKAAKPVRVDDEIVVRTPVGDRILVVVGLSERRGPASVARELYKDLTPPRPPKQVEAPVFERERGLGRPSKRDRRKMEKLRGGEY
ncbi:MAG: RNA-binding S4 domain-containing protein [Myxococcales bacterium]|nr:RNA-binding S4 domain-containing protein [Myxococcales bacterium]